MVRSRMLRWSLVGSMAVSGAALVLARPLLAASEVQPVPTTQKLPQVSKQSQVMKRVDVDMGTTTPGSGQRFDVLPRAGGPVVRDNQTGRMWERAPAATKYTFAAAKAMCDAKVLGAFSDWRLPRVECETLTLHRIEHLVDPAQGLDEGPFGALERGPCALTSGGERRAVEPIGAERFGEVASLFAGLVPRAPRLPEGLLERASNDLLLTGLRVEETEEPTHLAAPAEAEATSTPMATSHHEASDEAGCDERGEDGEDGRDTHGELLGS